MLFFIVCACFALFPEQVLSGAQSGLALCINVVVPSLLPFMLVSTCVIKSDFSRPLGAVLSKVLTPITGMSRSGCVCFITGIFGGYGAGVRAVYESFKKGDISKKEAERLMAFCNNAGPLFIIGTVGIGFFSNKEIGMMLLLVQIMTALICAVIFNGKTGKEDSTLSMEWEVYKKNKLSIGELITTSAVESAGAIINACVFVITFSAIFEILPFGKYQFLAGFLEVTRGVAELSREGYLALPVVSAVISWGGMSVHLQADALSCSAFSKKMYYAGRVFASVISFFLTKAIFADVYVFLFFTIICISLILILSVIKSCLKDILPHGFRQQRHS